MDSVTAALAGIFLPIFLGIIARTGNYIPARNRPVIQQFAVRITIPAMIFSSLREMDFQTAGQFLPMSLGLFIFMAMTWLALWGIIFLLQKRFQWIRRYRSELLLISFTGNVGYICWKLHELTAGMEGLQRGIFYTGFYWPYLIFFAFLTVHVSKLSRKRKPDKKEFAFNIIPILTMLFLGLAAGIGDARLPEWVIRLTDSFGSMAIPLVLFCMGLSISLKNSLKLVRPLVPFLMIRLAVWIGATWVMIHLPWYDDTSRQVLMINALAPLGVNPMVVSDMFGLDTEFIANSTVISTIIFLLFIPFIFFVWG